MNAKQDIPTPGTEIHGGYFAGIVQIDGQQYGVIVAPKAQGEKEGLWGKPGNKIPATHLADGMSNTKVMEEAGSDMADWAMGLDINGHQDWYIPARDELELIYRNLKPSTKENWCSFRDGENPSSVPPSGLYTEDSPVQTTLALFQEDGAEAMETSSWYWSSTQYSAYDAFVQVFDDGYQDYDRKDDTLRVRAVRRFLIN